mmetsp:Transcript_78618/g.218288  ORF Transcript_78618/g.218288 Transcript_78618/m.218288 type:complete len:244 (-) Transcript_78618:1749-2480(-)
MHRQRARPKCRHLLPAPSSLDTASVSPRASLITTRGLGPYLSPPPICAQRRPRRRRQHHWALCHFRFHARQRLPRRPVHRFPATLSRPVHRFPASGQCHRSLHLSPRRRSPTFPRQRPPQPWAPCCARALPHRPWFRRPLRPCHHRLPRSERSGIATTRRAYPCGGSVRMTQARRPTTQRWAHATIRRVRRRTRALARPRRKAPRGVSRRRQQSPSTAGLAGRVAWSTAQAPPWSSASRARPK